MKNLFENCTQFLPEQRPSLHIIKSTLAEFISASESAIKVKQNRRKDSLANATQFSIDYNPYNLEQTLLLESLSAAMKSVNFDNNPQFQKLLIKASAQMHSQFGLLIDSIFINGKREFKPITQ